MKKTKYKLPSQSENYKKSDADEKIFKVLSHFFFLNRYLNALLMFLYENPSTASPSTTESKAETPSGLSEFNLTVSSGKSEQKAHQLA